MRPKEMLVGCWDAMWLKLADRCVQSRPFVLVVSIFEL